MADGSQSGGEQVDQNDGASRSGTFAIVAVLAVILLVGVGAVVAAALLFGSDDSTVSSGSSPETSQDAPATDSTGSSSSSSPGDTTPSTAPADESGIGLEGAATTPVSVPFPAQETALLKDVRVAAQDGFDRVVFEFDGPVPGYVVKYVPGPITQDPSDLPVSVDGDKFIVITMNPASGVSLDGDTYEEVYTGPRSIDGPGTPVEQVVHTGDFEAVLTWTLGVTGEKPFKVSTLTSPSRLVVDVAN